MRSLVVVAMVAALTAPARAAPEPEPEAEPTQAYRVPMIGVDIGAAVFWLGGGILMYRGLDDEGEDFSGQLAMLGGLMYLGNGAFVHHDAGHDGRAVLSVAVRIGIPTLAGMIAHDRGAGIGTGMLAVSGGMAAAMAIDWFLLADARAPAKEPALSIYAAPSAGGMVAGLTGKLP